MANDSIQLYNFYKRYRWTAEDFTGWQTGMVDHSRGMFDGLFHGGVLQGFEITLTSGLALSVAEGIASGPNGFLNVLNSSTALTVDAATTSVRRDLIVIRPLLTDNTFITDPADPLSTVPLRTTQGSEIVIIKGTESTSPQYPSALSDDVILAGVRIEFGQTALAISDLDFEVRDALGKNSRFQQNQAKYDERCRVARETNDSIRIKPSQTKIGDNPKNFTYMNKSTPSRFPLDATSKFNFADTLISFQSGAITGGDQISADFTPTIPTAGNWITATVSLKSDDTLNVSYGIEGTKAQCLSAIESAVTSGAGGIALPSQMMRLAFVMLRSADGTNITELDVIDARSTLYFGGPDSPRALPNVFVSALGLGDVTTLSAALALLPTGSGVICIMDDVIETTTVTLPANTKLIGRGRNASLTFSAATGLITNNDVLIEDLTLITATTTTICRVNGNNNVISKCTFTAPSGNASAICVDVYGNANHIGECVFTGTASPSLATGIRYNVGSAENTNANCIFTP